MEFEKFESAMKRFASTVQKSSRIEKVAITQALGRILAGDVAAPFSTPRRHGRLRAKGRGSKRGG